mmetsp:Transcript_31293/g.68367  ORF Transcript_31293/g.68367 Transcript_31293/m.68367 type:complete len:356 (+) Transcript_31293:2548-3615(+)
MRPATVCGEGLREGFAARLEQRAGAVHARGGVHHAGENGGGVRRLYARVGVEPGGPGAAADVRAHAGHQDTHRPRPGQLPQPGGSHHRVPPGGGGQVHHGDRAVPQARHGHAGERGGVRGAGTGPRAAGEVAARAGGQRVRAGDPARPGGGLPHQGAGPARHEGSRGVVCDVHGGAAENGELQQRGPHHGPRGRHGGDRTVEEPDGAGESPSLLEGRQQARDWVPHLLRVRPAGGQHNGGRDDLVRAAEHHRVLQRHPHRRRERGRRQPQHPPPVPDGPQGEVRARLLLPRQPGPAHPAGRGGGAAARAGGGGQAVRGQPGEDVRDPPRVRHARRRHLRRGGRARRLRRPALLLV